MIWSLAPAVLIVFGINLQDRSYVRYVIPVPTMVQCVMAKPMILGEMKRRFSKDLAAIHLSGRCARRVPLRKPAPLWRDT